MGTSVAAGHSRRWLQRSRRRQRQEAAHETTRSLCGPGERHSCFRDPGGGEERRPGMRRRDFFAVLGGGILVLLVDDSDAQEAGGGARRGTNEPAPTALSAWLHIGEDGRITVYTGKVEVGQNARTHLLRR